MPWCRHSVIHGSVSTVLWPQSILLRDLRILLWHGNRKLLLPTQVLKLLYKNRTHSPEGFSMYGVVSYFRSAFLLWLAVCISGNTALHCCRLYLPAQNTALQASSALQHFTHAWSGNSCLRALCNSAAVVVCLLLWLLFTITMNVARSKQGCQMCGHASISNFTIDVTKWSTLKRMARLTFPCMVSFEKCNAKTNLASTVTLSPRKRLLRRTSLTRSAYDTQVHAQLPTSFMPTSMWKDACGI